MSEEKDKRALQEAELLMNRRGDERIEMQLPCRLLFPNIWAGSLDGYTANLHRSGVLVACDVQSGRDMPQVGEFASVHIDLPPSPNFPPKFMSCDTTLLRVDALGGSKFQFALEIRNVDFADLSESATELMKFDPDSRAYVM